MAGSIAMPLTTGCGADTYDELKTFVTAYLELDSTTAGYFDTFVCLAEAKMNRAIIAPERESSSTLVTTNGTQWVALPTDFRSLISARYSATDGWTLQPVSLNVINGDYSNSGNKAEPQVFAISQSRMYFGPIPDAAYSVVITYIADLDGISSNNQTNWLLTAHPDVYLYGIVVEALAFQEDKAFLPLFKQAFDLAVEEINMQGNRYRTAGPIRMRNPVPNAI